MKINLNTIGALVRPRIITHAKVYPRIIDSLKEEEKWDLAGVADSYYYSRDLLSYKKPYEELFKDLVIGDTTQDLSNCYVGMITSFIISISYKQYVLVDKNNVKDIVENLKRKNRSCESLPIHFVGIKFFKGVKRNKNGTLSPTDPWEATSSQHTWFYRPWDLVSMETVIRYEKLESGDLVLFKKTSGIVLKNKHINKKRFYKTNSWSCKSVSVLMGNGRTILRFLPNKSFKGRKSNESIEEIFKNNSP